MAAFAGIVTFAGAPFDARTEQQVAAAAAGPRRDRVVISRGSSAIVAQGVSRPFSVVSSGSVAPLAGDADDSRWCSGNDGFGLFIADVRLDNRAEMARALGYPLAARGQADDPDLLAQAFARWGDAGIARCLGAFAFALWRPAQRRLVLGRDCVGEKPLFFHRGDGFVAFASTLGGLLALPRVPRALDEIALANFLAVDLTARQQTFYRGIARVPSRCLVEHSPEGVEERPYWSPKLDAAPLYRRDVDYVERARELFDDAVAAVTADTPRLAIACSGGLDSSAIAATATRLGRAEAIACYSIVPPAGTQIDVGPAHYLDETDKLAALARLYPALDLHLLAPEQLHPYETDPVRYFARANMPVLGPTTLGAHGALYDAVAAARYPALLVGSAGNVGLSWNGAFSLRALLHDGDWRAFAHELFALAHRDGRAIARTFFTDVALPGVPLVARRLMHRLRGRDPDSVRRYSALNPQFIADHDLKRRWRDEGFEAWPMATGWHARSFRARRMFDLNQMGRDSRGMSADINGFEIRDPFSNRCLLEFALAVPEWLYRRDGVPRAFARAVFADRLPRVILEERRRGRVAPTWFRRLDLRRKEIDEEVERLEASPLARRLIDIPRLKGLLAQWPADEQVAEQHRAAYRSVLTRGLHVGSFIRWVEGGNA